MTELFFAVNWLRQVMKDKSIKNYLAKQGIKWWFNLSQAPWWGGQFKRLVGLVKSAMYKTIGQRNLSRKELQDVIIDVEVALNNRLLDYLENDVQLPVLTPNALLFGQPNVIPALKSYNIEETHLRKRTKYFQKCKDAVWRSGLKNT